MKKLYFSTLLTILCFGFVQAQELKDSFEVFFDFNKSKLTKSSISTIDSFLEASKTRRLKIRVTGHTCDIGSDNYNLGLSEKRAIAAFDYIKGTGEPEDKIELFFYGEKELKYGTGGKAENRRVFVLFALEDDDKDRTEKKGCFEILVEKGAFSPNKTKDVEFDLQTFNTAAAIKNANIKLEDVNGKKYITNGIAFFSAKFQGQKLESSRGYKIKMPAVGADEKGFTLFTGVDQNGSIVWKSTGKPCSSIEKDGSCATYKLDLQESGYCACLKARECEEDCNENPFGGEKSPNLSDSNIKSSSENTIVKVDNGMYKSTPSNLEVIDDKSFDEDLDICEQFTFDLVTENWFPSWRNINATQNIIVKAKDESGNLMTGEKSLTTRVLIPVSKVAGQNLILLSGNRTNKGYIKWEESRYDQIKCLGSINCEYVVYEVPASGNYKLGTWEDVKNEQPKEGYVLKTKGVKNSSVLVGNKENNYVYKALNKSKKGKTKPRDYSIREVSDVSKLVILVKNDNGKKKRYAEITLTDKDVKYKAKKKVYILRKKALKKVSDFNEIELSKCK
jgi:hypothetical protein